MTLQLRRGTTATRTAVTLEVGEPGWDTDLNALFVGDGTTAGGVRVAGDAVAPHYTAVTNFTMPAGTVDNQSGLVRTAVAAGTPAAQATSAAATTVAPLPAAGDDVLTWGGGMLDADFVTAVADRNMEVFVASDGTTIDVTDATTYRIAATQDITNAATGTIDLVTGVGTVTFTDLEELVYVIRTRAVPAGAYYWDDATDLWVAVP